MQEELQRSSDADKAADLQDMLEATQDGAAAEQLRWVSDSLTLVEIEIVLENCISRCTLEGRQ